MPDFGWGSAPDPAGGAYSAPPDHTLTQHAVDCNTVNSFKRCVDHYIRDKGY